MTTTLLGIVVAWVIVRLIDLLRSPDESPIQGKDEG